MNILKKYQQVRKRSLEICAPLQTEDYVIQPVVDVSPPKWHLGHTTWFFETFILKDFQPGYQEFNSRFNYIFNSYYETVGARVIRTDRGNLSRPTVEEVKAYREYVDDKMNAFLSTEPDPKVTTLLTLGLNHEEQHQELLYYDIKYILGHNPLFPPYVSENIEQSFSKEKQSPWVSFPEGLCQIGHTHEDFCFDNELNSHSTYLQAFSISPSLVSNKEYLEFMTAGGYEDFRHWHSEGWEWVRNLAVKAPLYWYQVDGQWHRYSLSGLQSVDGQEPVCHVNYFEAAAYASWAGKRLPTEFEWERASREVSWGKLWEWTESAYLPYPGFTRASGATGEYNGKFMVNQKVLRGASVATSPGHSRFTYRNFFHPHLRWHYCGIRLAE